MFRNLTRVSVIQCLIGIHFWLTYCVVTSPFLNLKDYFAYRAELPFQARVLPALIFNALSTARFWPHVDFTFGRMLPHEYATYFLALTMVSVFTVLILFRDILIRGIKFQPLTVDAAMFALLGCMYFNYAIGYEFKFFLPYDLPSMALLTTVLWLAYQRRVLWLLLAFAVATMNRETVLILIPCVAAVLFFHHRMNKRVCASMAIVMLVIWVAVKIALYEAFGRNPHEGNGLASWKIVENMHFLLNPAHWPQILSTWAFLSIPFALNWRRITSPCLRVFKWVVVGMLVILLVTGLLIETRIFGELSLLVILCLAGVLNDFTLTLTARRADPSSVPSLVSDGDGAGPQGSRA